MYFICINFKLDSTVSHLSSLLGAKIDEKALKKDYWNVLNPIHSDGKKKKGTCTDICKGGKGVS